MGRVRKRRVVAGSHGSLLYELNRWFMVAFAIVGTALTVGGVLPEPWDKCVNSVVASLYAWGLVRKPKEAMR